MPVTNYPIFEPAKRKKIYFEFFSLGFICLGAVAFVWMKSQAEIHPAVFWIITIFFILSFVPLIVTLILNHYKIDFKRGKFKGNLVLGKNEIRIAEKTVLLDTIETIHFINDDFFIRYERNKWIGPKISSGVGNICSVKTKDGKKYQFNFYQSHDNELVKAEVLLRWYHSKKILSTNNLNHILNETN